MARVLALVPDLLFGSRVKAALAQSGHDPELIARAGELRERLAGGDVDVLVIDLADPDLDGVGILSGLAADGTSAGVRTLGFYAHVDADARARAVDAGFDLVVPRSRMAREGPALIETLLAR